MNHIYDVNIKTFHNIIGRVLYEVINHIIFKTKNIF